MKKRTIIYTSALFALFAALSVFTSCTEGLDGDGDGTIYYPGSTLPQNTSYRNPVWEPDLNQGIVFKASSGYIAIGSQTEWATGITYNAPIIASNNLMDWTFSSKTAFPLAGDPSVVAKEKRPDWAEGKIHSMAAAFARTLARAPYWLFYQLGDTPAIGAAYATTPQGPFYDLGKLMDTANTASSQLKDPFFIVVGSRFYLFYSTENGTYMQELGIISKENMEMPTLRNAPVKISNAEFANVAIYRKDDYYYAFGTVKNGTNTYISYGRSETVAGPYVDIDGNDLLTNNGMPIIESGTELVNPENVCGVFADFDGNDFILYNATDVSKPVLPSGYNRRPLIMNKLTITEDGWFTGIVKPNIGWTTPKFKDK